jgi:GNAT superfamily N-acetyltransferase
VADRAGSAPATLPGGQQVWIRPIGTDDADALRAAFERLSLQSRYQRFHSGVPRLSDVMVRVLTTVDHVDREALVAVPAEESSELVGVVRYVRDPAEPTVADLAITVADDWQGLGLGALLMRELTARAIGNGIEHFTVDMLADNVPIQALVRTVGGVRVATDGSVVSARVSILAPAQVMASAVVDKVNPV